MLTVRGLCGEIAANKCKSIELGLRLEDIETYIDSDWSNMEIIIEKEGSCDGNIREQR